MKVVFFSKFQKVLLSVLVLVLFLAVGCSRVNDGMVHGRHAIIKVLDNAERVMPDDPEYAWELINTVDIQNIHSRSIQARFALLYTEAQYKNYYPITSDSLIMEAVRYYSIGADVLDRFKSYYYLGCVYAGLGQLSDAAVAFTQAEQLSIKNDDNVYYWHGLLYSQLGDVFYRSYDFERAEDYFIKSADNYDLAGKEYHKIYSLYDIATCQIGMHNFKTGDSILQIVQNWAIEHENNQLNADCLYDRLSCSLYMNELDSSDVLFNSYITMFGEPDQAPYYLKNLALYYNEIGDYARSYYYLNKAWECNLTTSDSINLFYVGSLLEKNMGHTEKAFDNYKNYTSLQNNKVRSILRQPVLGAQSEHFKTIAENELLKINHVKMTFILCTVIMLLIITILVFIYHYNKQRVEKQLYESLTVVEELTAANHRHSDQIEQLKNQVRTQFHERHDLSNRLYSMYFDSENQEKVTKQQLTVTVNNLIKEYTAPESVKKLDSLLNDTYDGIMNRLSAQEIGLSEKEKQLLRFSFIGLSSKSVSVILKESPQNVYQLKSRLLKKVRKISEELWQTLDNIL